MHSHPWSTERLGKKTKRDFGPKNIAKNIWKGICPGRSSVLTISFTKAVLALHVTTHP
jgi:hypothetical protein